MRNRRGMHWASLALVLLCTPAGALVPQLLDWFKNSEFVARKHAEHRQSESVVHMMKGTVLAAAPDDKKLEAVDRLWPTEVENADKARGEAVLVAGDLGGLNIDCAHVRTLTVSRAPRL